MEEKFNRKETWENSHGGAPVKCVLDVGKNLRYFFDQTMAVNGLTGIQTRVLGHIHVEEVRGNSVYQRDIEEVFRIKRSSVTSVLQTLEKKGLVDIDYFKPLKGFDMSAYKGLPVHGTMALTQRGQTVVEMLEIQGIE